jgi:ribosome recycling factor
MGLVTITDESACQEYVKCEAAMQASTDYFRKDCAAAENRALGRVTPALLTPVKVKLPENPNGVRLEELATVGVREGSTLLITLFNEHVSVSPWVGNL